MHRDQVSMEPPLWEVRSSGKRKIGPNSSSNLFWPLLFGKILALMVIVDVIADANGVKAIKILGLRFRPWTQMHTSRGVCYVFLQMCALDLCKVCTSVPEISGGLCMHQLAWHTRPICIEYTYHLYAMLCGSVPPTTFCRALHARCECDDQMHMDMSTSGCSKHGCRWVVS